jgi:hypothetical protein
MGEYQETCHEENLCGFPPFALFNYLLSKEKHNKERICTKGVGWRGLYQKTDLRKRPTRQPSLLHAQGIRCTLSDSFYFHAKGVSYSQH